MKVLKTILGLIWVLLLTILTQIGGLIWLLSIGLSRKFKFKNWFIFPILYLFFNLLIIPPIAKTFGRERLPIFDSNLKPRNIAYPLLFRNYVNTDLKDLLETSAENLKNQNIEMTHLDANFPFINGFPLLPHLSHSDGKKVDLAFMYLDQDQNPTSKKPSTSGYGVYINSENKTSDNCIKKGYWQYDFPKYLTLGTNNELKFDKKRTKNLILELLRHQKTRKIFIEPYLKENLNLSKFSKIRFHGCQAVRHDDHIHLQIN